MIWSVSNLIIQVVTGVLGAHAAAIVVKEHSFGFIGHTLTGATAGALGGVFLQELAVTMVTGSGNMNAPTAVENAVLQGAAGAASGACLMLVVGLIKHAIDEHRVTRR
jgi:hypothetical protein